MPTCAYALYLGRLSSNSRKSIQSQFNTIGHILQWPKAEIPARIQVLDYQSAMHCRSQMVAAGMATRSINRAMIALKGLMKVSVLVGNVNQMQLLQIQSIPNLKCGEHHGTPLTSQQATKLLNHLEGAKSTLEIRNASIIAILLSTGMRRSEIISLRIQDLNIVESTLFIAKGKGNKSRSAFIPSWTHPFLNKWIEIRGNSTGYLFCNVLSRSSRTSKLNQVMQPIDTFKNSTLGCLKFVQKVTEVDVNSHMDGSTIYRIVRSTTSILGLENISPHDFRRTFITRLLELNVDINTVRQMAGHASISTTTLYDKRDKRFMQQAANRLNFTE